MSIMDKPNKMTNVYIGFVVERMYKGDTPTMELRVRVPTIHGLSAKRGVPNEALPIAKPLFTPGISYSKAAFEEAFQHLNKVYVIFESGDEESPVYLGLKGNSELYDIPIGIGSGDFTITGDLDMLSYAILNATIDGGEV